MHHPGWQSTTLQTMINGMAGVGSIEPYGSILRPDELDNWSDLDVRIELTEPIDVDILGLGEIWAWQDVRSGVGQTLRLVFCDGRRIDLSVVDSVIMVPEPPADNQIRFDASLAASRYGRGNRLIGLHLTLGILREALVFSMLLRDRAEGTDHHRLGSEFEERAEQVAKIISSTQIGRRPTVVQRACELYGRWRTELESDYTPDWSGLTAVIDLGTAGTLKARESSS
ncbi:hypothetical protein FOE78_22230 [Microlunatus elymi]|uniref:Nucleotidyltransferase domain-containing protein n=1 Tax=Microlunatus elymi TaxID=2596828 RepID=A0A516Q493_9ACTN|nr:hypothetical protein [Microlunatus elymi]QDP98260.1 hypothetical protein FOE78_22230 [Microlunatus elymi]